MVHVWKIQILHVKGEVKLIVKKAIIMNKSIQSFQRISVSLLATATVIVRKATITMSRPVMASGSVDGQN
jgi:hypothetical protein